MTSTMENTKRKVKQMLDEIASGHLEVVLDLLKSSSKALNDATRLKLLITCCQLCASNISSPENVAEEVLYEILLEVVPAIKSIPCENLLSFNQSMFHILKLFIKKGCYVIVVKMKDIAFPQFLPDVLPEEQQKIFSTLLHFLYKSLRDSCIPEEVVIEICPFIFKACHYVCDLTLVLPTIYGCISLNLTNTGRSSIYLSYLSFLRKQHFNTTSEACFEFVISILYTVLNGYIGVYEYKAAKNFLDVAISESSVISEQDVHSHLHDLFRFPLLFFHVYNDMCSILKNCRDSFNTISKILESQKLKVSLLDNINSLLSTVIRYDKLAGHWMQIPEDVQYCIFEFIYEISLVDAKIELQCSCNCLCQYNAYRGSFYSWYIGKLITLYCASAKSTIEYHKKCIELLNRFFNYVVELKANKCRNVESAFGRIVNSVYNVAVKLSEYSREDALLYFYFVIDKYIQFRVSFSASSLRYSLNAIFINLQDDKKLMALSALSVYLSPTNEKGNYMAFFVKAKHRLSRDESGDSYKEITLVSAFSILKEYFYFLSQPVLLKTDEKVNLLIYELQYYNKKWRSKVPMMVATSELVKVADLDVAVKTVVDIFEKGPVHEKIPGLIWDLLQKYEKRHKRVSKYNLAALNFLHHHYKQKEILKKNLDEMEQDMFSGRVADPSDECDIVSWYECLKLDRFVPELKFLNRSLQLFSEILSEEGSANFTGYHFLMKIYHEYMLHKYSVPAIRALELALEVAKNCSCTQRIVEVTSFLLETSHFSENYLKNLCCLAEQHLKGLNCEDTEHMELFARYYLSKGKAYLYTECEASYKYVIQAQELINKMPQGTNLPILKSRIHFIRHKFLMMPCDLNNAFHKDASISDIHLAVSTLQDEYKNHNLEGSYGMTLLLEFSEELSKFYYLMRCPREVRAYSKEAFVLTRNLVLPLRCAVFLQYLIYADLRTNRLDDGRYKLNGMAEILCLDKMNVSKEPEPTIIADSDIEGYNVENDLQEMALDKPFRTKRYHVQLSPSSPQFEIHPFRMPRFVNHTNSCDCFFCVCLHYQILVLEKVRLDALLNIKLKNNDIAQELLEGALNLYECCREMCSRYESVAGKIISKDLIPMYNVLAVHTYCGVLLDYSYHLRRLMEKDKAMEVNDRLLACLMPRKIEHIYLYQEALIQRLGYITEVKEDVRNVVEIENEEDIQTAELPVTPESKSSKVVFKVSPNIEDDAGPPVVIKKKIPFILSPSPDSEMLVPYTTPTPKKAPKTINTKTPAAKIPIYCESIKKSTKKRLEAVTTSPERLKVPSVVVKTNLRSRTKILTDKLRQSKQKQRKQTNNDAGEGTSCSIARKALFPETPTQSGSVRRSQRNK